MTRRERLQGHSYALANGIRVLVRRSCRDELKLIYEAPCFDEALLDEALLKELARRGSASVLRASKINPAMKDLYRIALPGVRLEVAAGGGSLLAFFKGFGRLRARHELEALLAGVRPRSEMAPG